MGVCKLLLRFYKGDISTMITTEANQMKSYYNPRQYNNKNRYIASFTVAVLSLLVLFSSLLVTTSEANTRVHDRLIRVGLLMDQGGHVEAVPYVTLSSPLGLEISTPLQTPALMQVLPSEEMVFHLNQFYLLIEETTDLQRARSVDTALKALNYRPLIVEENLFGSIRYQVLVGYYSSLAQAQAEANKLKGESTYSPTVRGNFRVQAGAFTERDKAEAVITELRNRGYLAYLVIGRQGGNLLYRVWVGNEETPQLRDLLRSELAVVFVGSTFIAAEANDAFLLLKRGQINNKQIQIGVLPANQTRTIAKALAGNGNPVVKVNERFNRLYRGVIELTMHNSKLAVVNELPMDQYLYGVVPREMATGWPMEALKAQAVIARTFALGRNGYVIAQVVDDVKDQAYSGFSIEAADTNRAVDETRGQVLRTASGGLAQTFYSSNTGGMSAKGTEVWGTDVAYLQPVASPYDAAILDRISKWYRVMLADGRVGYIHSNFVKPTGELNSIGLRKAIIDGTNVNVRANADIYHTSITRVNSGDRVTIVEEAYENNAYQWSRGPYNAIEMRNMINSNQRSTNPMIQNPVLSLEVTQRGPSGRVMQVRANAAVVSVSSPDAHRSLFRDGSSLRSTLFEIEARGSYQILGANGITSSHPRSDNPANLFVLGSTSANTPGGQPTQVNGNNDHFMVMNKDGNLRVASKRQEYVFNGFGFGHGFGLSQWGAFGMATARDGAGNLKYNYVDILHHYYSKDVYLTPIE